MISQSSGMPSESQSDLALVRESPFVLQSRLDPEVISHSSGVPFELQSVSQSSGMRVSNRNPGSHSSEEMSRSSVAVR